MAAVLLLTTLNLLPAGAVTLLLLHIVTSLRNGTFTPQYHCVVSSFFLARLRITAQAETAGKLKPSAPQHHTKMPDLDKLCRGVADSIGDAVAQVLLKNDSQIVSLYATKRYQTDDFLGAIITVTALD